MVTNKLYLDYGSENEFSVRGYRLNYVKATLLVIFSVLTAGLAILPLYWKPNWLIYALFSEASTLNNASDVLIEDFYQRSFRRRLFKMEIKSDLTWNMLQQRLWRQINNDQMAKKVPTKDKSQPKIDLESINFDLDETGYHLHLLCFTFQKSIYIISSDGGSVAKLPSLSAGMTASEAVQNIKHGLSSQEVESRKGVFGPNELDINPKSIAQLMVQEVLHPFYLFQLFSVTVWFIDEYIYYSICIIVLSVFSIAWALYMTYSEQKKVISMTKGDFVIEVLRDSVVENIWQKDLVPGDIVIIPQRGCSMNFDALLLTGSCIVNESMLTGESVPVTKAPFSQASGNQAVYSEKSHAKHTLFSGTSVLQSRTYSNDHCYAIVINTGFHTMKGELIRSILYPKPMSFRLFFDAIMFVVFLLCVAMIGFVYTLVLMINRQKDLKEIILKPLDIITIAVPPALPAALNIGMVFAQRRLRNRKIFCVSPQRIDVAGSIDVVCFDKTGTLTEDNMTFKHLVTIDEVTNVLARETSDVKTLEPDSKLAIGISTCHTLTKIEGKIVGDPMDLKLFTASGWTYSEQGTGSGFDFDSLAPSVVSSPRTETGLVVEVGLVRQFPFSSEMQRMAVIVRDSRKNHYDFFVKGSPEKVAAMCKQLPGNFSQSLEYYANSGYRVLALAYRPLDSKMAWHKVHKATLNDLEQNLEFLGLLVFCNQLKRASAPVIHKLHAANIRSIMVTGDNIATAVAVARNCSLVRENKQMRQFCTRDDVFNFAHKASSPSNSAFALSGHAFSALMEITDTAVLNRFLERTSVYARMKPEQKSELVEKLQNAGFYVGMVGDGANDCGALKMAHVGISLSELEASAASPFTSAIPDVSCVDKLIREGRASLVNSFATFKFMGLYSMIQFSSVVILYWYNTTLGDFQFLYIDMGIITALMLSMGRTEASGKISEFKPPVRLFNGVVFISLIAAIIAQFAAQCFSLFALMKFSWYTPVDPEVDVDVRDSVQGQENTAICYSSMLLYIVCAVGFSPGPPHRKHLITNYPYVAVIIILVLGQMVIMFHPESWTSFLDYSELVYIDSVSFKLIIIIISLLCLALLVVLDFYLLANKHQLPSPGDIRDSVAELCSRKSPVGKTGSKFDVSSASNCSPKSQAKYSSNSLPDYAVLAEEKFDGDLSNMSGVLVISSL